MLKLFVLLLAGLGDALGVDWASLVADVRRREQPAPTGGARDRWRPERVLARIGLSLEMAGADTVRDILEKNAKINEAESKAKEKAAESNEVAGHNGNGKHHEDEKPFESAPLVDMDSLHPVAEIQVCAWTFWYSYLPFDFSSHYAVIFS